MAEVAASGAVGGGTVTAEGGDAVTAQCDGCRDMARPDALYFCTVCHALRCQRLTCSVEAVEAMYCPLCFCRFGTFESIEHRHK